MNLNFNRVTYDGDLEDFDEDELRTLVEEYENAQESNVAEFEEAAEALDGIDQTDINDFETAREELISDITEAEAFESVPATEDDLADAEFSKLREWQDFVEAQAADDGDDPDEPGEGADGEFDDMGKQAPKNDNEDETDGLSFEMVDGLAGVNAPEQ